MKCYICFSVSDNMCFSRNFVNKKKQSQ